MIWSSPRIWTQPLTTIRQGVQRQGEEAAHVLFEFLSDPGAGPARAPAHRARGAGLDGRSRAASDGARSLGERGSGRTGSGFLWGAATSAYQVEGAVKEDGRGVSIWDIFCRKPGAVLGGTRRRRVRSVPPVRGGHRPHGRARDRAYRFSIAWPRILPEGGGAVNQQGLDHYRRSSSRSTGTGSRRSRPCITGTPAGARGSRWLGEPRHGVPVRRVRRDRARRARGRGPHVDHDQRALGRRVVGVRDRRARAREGGRRARVGCVPSPAAHRVGGGGDGRRRRGRDHVEPPADDARLGRTADVLAAGARTCT
jgi:hypothetical protein